MAMARTPRMTGAFHGAMPSTTPAGCRTPMARLPGTSDGMTSPLICVVSAAASQQHAGGQVHVEAGPHGRGAGLARHRPRRSLGRSRLERLRRLHQQGAPLTRADRGPGREGPRRRVDRGDGVADAGGRRRVATLPSSGLRRSNCAPLRPGRRGAVDQHGNGASCRVSFRDKERSCGVVSRRSGAAEVGLADDVGAQRVRRCRTRPRPRCAPRSST